MYHTIRDEYANKDKETMVNCDWTNFDTLEEAKEYANLIWSHLTEQEQAKNEVYVNVTRFDEEPLEGMMAYNPYRPKATIESKDGKFEIALVSSGKSTIYPGPMHLAQLKFTSDNRLTDADWIII